MADSRWGKLELSVGYGDDFVLFRIAFGLPSYHKISLVEISFCTLYCRLVWQYRPGRKMR